jgi:hypothetical protein
MTDTPDPTWPEAPDPPPNCRVGAVWRHKTANDRARIQRVYFDYGMSFKWRVVLAGGTEFVDQVRHPGTRAVPNAMFLDGLMSHWEYDRD